MAWLISAKMMEDYENLRFSPVLAAAFSAESCSAGEPCAPSKSNPTPLAYLPSDKMKEFSTLSRSWITFALLTESRGEDLLTWYRADSLAKTSVSPEKAQALPANDPDYGSTWRASLARYDLTTCSWKIHQRSLIEDSASFLAIWPKSGMTRNTVFYQRPTLAQSICGKGFGALPDGETFFNTPNTTSLDGGSNSRRSLKKRMQAKLWATPASSDGTRGGTITDNMTGKSLSQQIASPCYWPTPRANDAEKRGNVNPHDKRNGLVGAVISFPTPAASCFKASGHSKKKQGSPNLQTVVTGSLNPDWVEKLMLWPEKWTSLDEMPDMTNWGSIGDDWEAGTPRTTEMKTHRAARLKAIGNGQVPRCAAAAFAALAERMESA